MRDIEYNGVKVSYDAACTLSYRWQKAINSGDPARMVNAISRLFDGRDEYYAYAIGASDPMGYDEWLAKGDDFIDGSMDGMSGLLTAVMEDMGQTAKN